VRPFAGFVRGNAVPPVDQLLGVNNHDVAVGFYTDANGNTDGLLATPLHQG
jgi:hypothetical protein